MIELFTEGENRFVIKNLAYLEREYCAKKPSFKTLFVVIKAKGNQNCHSFINDGGFPKSHDHWYMTFIHKIDKNNNKTLRISIDYEYLKNEDINVYWASSSEKNNIFVDRKNDREVWETNIREYWLKEHIGGNWRQINYCSEGRYIHAFSNEVIGKIKRAIFKEIVIGNFGHQHQ